VRGKTARLSFFSRNGRDDEENKARDKVQYGGQRQEKENGKQKK
jgi:hypothetical protein